MSGPELRAGVPSIALPAKHLVRGGPRGGPNKRGVGVRKASTSQFGRQEPISPGNLIFFSQAVDSFPTGQSSSNRRKSGWGSGEPFAPRYES